MDIFTKEENAKISLENQDSLILCTPLSDYVRRTVSNYLAQLDENDTVNLYEMVMSEVEKPLLEVALENSGHNQTKAAKTLGVSRTTLRKKMDSYGLS